MDLCAKCKNMGIIRENGVPVPCGCSMSSLLEDSAATLLNWVGSWNPTWRERLDVAQEEMGWTALQQAGNYLIENLEHGRHLNKVNHFAFLTGAAPTPQFASCAYEPCGKPFKPSFPGQLYCGNACADKGMPPPARPKPKKVRQPEEA